jgi:hypothetical protein
LSLFSQHFEIIILKKLKKEEESEIDRNLLDTDAAVLGCGIDKIPKIRRGIFVGRRGGAGSRGGWHHSRCSWINGGFGLWEQASRREKTVLPGLLSQSSSFFGSPGMSRLCNPIQRSGRGAGHGGNQLLLRRR